MSQNILSWPLIHFATVLQRPFQLKVITSINIWIYAFRKSENNCESIIKLLVFVFDIDVSLLWPWTADKHCNKITHNIFGL